MFQNLKNKLDTILFYIIIQSIQISNQFFNSYLYYIYSISI